MPDDDRVGTHRLQCERGVLEALALGHRGPAGGEVDDVRGEALGRQLERDSRSGRVLVEEIDHGTAPQGGDLLDDSGAKLPQALRDVQDPDDVLRGELIDRKKMLDHAGPRPRPPPDVAGSCLRAPATTASSPSTSARRTWTSSSQRVGTFFPTKSARMGSSR